MSKSISPFHFWTYFLWEILKREKTFQHFYIFYKKINIKKNIARIKCEMFFCCLCEFYAGFCGFFAIYVGFLLVFC